MVDGAMHEKKEKGNDMLYVCQALSIGNERHSILTRDVSLILIKTMSANKTHSLNTSCSIVKFWVSINGCQNIYLSKPFAITDGFTIFKTSILSIGTLAVIKRKKSDRYKCTVG